MFLHGFMSFAAICAIIACLLIMGSFVLIMMNLQHMITDLEQESEILVYIDEDLTTAEAKSVGSNINMITNVDESIFVSREQALEDYIAQQDDPSIFEGVEADTLRDRFRVSLRDISQTERTVAEIEQIDGVGVIFQDFRLIEKKTVFENVAFAMRVIGASEQEIKRRVPYVLELVGLENKGHRLPQELSGGEQQRVAIARALINNPQMIIADEPTGNLDPARSLEIMMLLEQINALGTTMMVVTHEKALVNRFSKRVVAIDEGLIISDGMDGYYTYEKE